MDAAAVPPRARPRPDANGRLPAAAPARCRPPSRPLPPPGGSGPATGLARRAVRPAPDTPPPSPPGTRASARDEGGAVPARPSAPRRRPAAPAPSRVLPVARGPRTAPRRSAVAPIADGRSPRTTRGRAGGEEGGREARRRGLPRHDGRGESRVRKPKRRASLLLSSLQLVVIAVGRVREASAWTRRTISDRSADSKFRG